MISRKADERIDHYFHKGDTLFGCYSYNNVKTNVPGWFPTLEVAGLSVEPSGDLMVFRMTCG